MALLDLEKDFFEATVASYEQGLEENWENNYERAKSDWALWHYCFKCGEKIYISPNSDAHNAIIEYMKEKGWGHPQCHQQ
jgi:hypothetical protein